MSNDTQRADQIAHRLYSKLAIVVNHARATIEPPPTAKVDKWVRNLPLLPSATSPQCALFLQFNLETPDPEIFKEHTRIYRSISSASTVPLFQLQVLLCVPELASNQVLVYSAPDSSRVCIDPTPRYIVLESWSIEFTPNHAGSQGSDDRVDVAPSTIYKHGIPLFRTIFTLLHVLPAWKLARRLRGRGGGGVGRRNGNFSIQLRVDSVDGSIRPEDILSFDNTPASLRSVLQHESHVLPPITHPMGELQVSATYLTHPTFQLDTRESLLSSRFLSEGPDFTPTLVKNHERCRSLEDRIPLPTRLIDCSDPLCPRIIETKDLNTCDPYIALSYVWGEAQPHRTTTDNLPSYMKSLDIALLPQTVRDAIRITHTLGVQYLWIDSLCIIQDSREDKHRELTKMRDVYLHAWLTIDAGNANRVSQGFLHDGQPLSESGIPLLCPPRADGGSPQVGSFYILRHGPEHYDPDPDICPHQDEHRLSDYGHTGKRACIRKTSPGEFALMCIIEQ
ncbi:hypothetical protein ONZ51_g11976 [Trametes cubensis]|uniref:Autophagy-related protein 13 n=1 Tax=Trametes cubensis TaxID=1111947 RepID=A0AAD7TGL9_9APHY|nr:hypothetical protein ONZ51_g11976 [Trametes cubensis]